MAIRDDDHSDDVEDSRYKGDQERDGKKGDEIVHMYVYIYIYIQIYIYKYIYIHTYIYI
jgi:hypothetical protein